MVFNYLDYIIINRWGVFKANEIRNMSTFITLKSDHKNFLQAVINEYLLFIKYSKTNYLAKFENDYSSVTDFNKSMYRNLFIHLEVVKHDIEKIYIMILKIIPKIGPLPV